jgi:hypothetical protein
VNKSKDRQQEGTLITNLNIDGIVNPRDTISPRRSIYKVTKNLSPFDPSLPHTLVDGTDNSTNRGP